MQICGNDGKTYGNMDDMKSASCNMNKRVAKSHNGACQKSKEDDEGNNSKYVIIVVVLVLVLALIVGIAAYWIYTKRRSASSKDLQDGEKSSDNLL